MRARIADLRPSQLGERIYSTEPTPDLIESIKANGILVPIWITEDRTIIAGHRRVNACRTLGIAEIEAEVKPYSDLLVIESNRYRQKTWAERLREAQYLERIEKPKAEKRRKAGVVTTLSQGGRTRTTVARAIGTSEGTLDKVQTIAEQKPELIAEIDAGKMCVDSAYRQLKREQGLAEFHKREPPLPEGRFNVLYADPPWRYEYSLATSREIENQYPTMTLDDLCNLPIRDIADTDSILFLWATSPKLTEALQVMKAWGFGYRTSMVWVKDKIGMGYYTRQKHELLLIGKRGSFPVPEPSTRPDSVIEAPRRGHSEKPEVVYGLIENMYPTGKYLELFARAERPGWKAWGFEAGNARVGAKGSDSLCGRN